MRLFARDCRVHILADSRFPLLSAAAEDHRVAPHAKPLKVIWKPRPQGQKGRSSSKKKKMQSRVYGVINLLSSTT